jgi:hypothetical protein
MSQPAPAQTPGQIFDSAYFASKPPQQRALYAGRAGNAGVALTPEEVVSLAQELMEQGLVIDPYIDGMSGDPWVIMSWRIASGFKWWPSAMNNQQIYTSITPGTEPNPPYSPYDPDHPPAGSIKSSVDLADYPPYPEPPGPPAPDPTILVGALIFGTLYNLTKAASDTYAAGKLPHKCSQNGHGYQLVVNQFAVGQQVYWNQVS